MKSKIISGASVCIVLVLATVAYLYLFKYRGGTAAEPIKPLPAPEIDVAAPSDNTPQLEKVVFAGGCFWCTEAVFEQLEGVKDVISGYAGGTREHANYDDVCAGITDHAEAIQITYDPSVISYGTLLKVFFTTAHDPTQLNRQGPDVGRQYRSAIFYDDDEEMNVAEAYIAQLNEDGVYSAPIVTKLEPLTEFFKAEEYHQDYVARNPYGPYVRGISLPKVWKTQQKFPELLKKTTDDDEVVQQE